MQEGSSTTNTDVDAVTEEASLAVGEAEAQPSVETIIPVPEEQEKFAQQETGQSKTPEATPADIFQEDEDFGKDLGLTRADCNQGDRHQADRSGIWTKSDEC